MVVDRFDRLLGDRYPTLGNIDTAAKLLFVLALGHNLLTYLQVYLFLYCLIGNLGTIFYTTLSL